MTTLILTQSVGGNATNSTNAFETIISDSGSVTASSPNSILQIIGGHAASITATGSPASLVIDVNANEISIEELLNVYVGSPISGGYTLVYREGSPNGWFAEPSTTTDEFVKVSGSDTSTGHLISKLTEGTGINFSTINPGSNEQLQISVDSTELILSLGDLVDVQLGSPISIGDVLSFDGSDWVPTNLSSGTGNISAGNGIRILNLGSPNTSIISLDVCTLPTSGSPSTLSLDDSFAVCDGSNTFKYTIDQLGDVLNIVFYEIFDDMREPTGHVNRVDSAVSFNSTSRTFTIQPSGIDPFRYYIHGVPFDISISKSIILPNATGSYYIYFDVDENLHYQTSFDEDLLMDVAYTAVVHWNAAPTSGTNSLIYQGDERHGITMDGQTHAHLHFSFGTQYGSGLALNGLNPDVGSPTDPDIQFNVENGWIRDEDLAFFIRDNGSIPVHPFDLVQDLAPTAQIPILFRDSGGSDWNITTSNSFPLIYSDGVVFTGASGLPPYNAESGGSWTLQEVANNSFFLVHYLATNDPNNPIVAIQGVANYNNRPAGQDQAKIELGKLTGLPFEEFVPIATVIFEARTSYTNTPNVRAVTTSNNDPYIDWRTFNFNSTTGGSGVNDHGNLSGLQDDDHPQYSTDSYDSISDGTNIQNASGRSNSIIVRGEDGINVTVGQFGSPAVDSISIGLDGQIQMSIINGQPTLTYVDDTRGIGSPPIGKRLSVAEQNLIYSQNQLNDNDWLPIGNVSDTDSGIVADFDGTVTFATGHCENTGANSKTIHLFINGIDYGSLGVLSGGINASFINTTIDVDFNQGDVIRLQSQQGTGGAIQDSLIKLTIKWRTN